MKTMTVILIGAIATGFSLTALVSCSPYANHEGFAAGNFSAELAPVNPQRRGNRLPGEVFELAFAERLDRAVAEGRMTEERRERLLDKRERRLSGDYGTGRGGRPGRSGLRWLVDESGEPLSGPALAERLDRAVAEGRMTEERRERILGQRERRLSGDYRVGRGESRNNRDGGHRRGQWLFDENGELLSEAAFVERLDRAIAEGLIAEESRERLLGRHGRHLSGERSGESRGSRGRGHGGRAS